MRKKFLIILFLFLFVCPVIWAGGEVYNWSGRWDFITTDTVTITGIDTKNFTAFGFKCHVISPDTVDVDSVIWKIEMSDTRECSSTIVVACDTSVNDATIDTSAYWFRADTLTASVFPERYWKLSLTLREQTAVDDDTLYPDSTAIDDWSVSAAESSFKAVDEILGAEDTTGAGGYVFVTKADSFEAWIVGDPNDKGRADSVVVWILANESDGIAGGIHACSVAFAVCIDDTGTCTWVDTVGLTKDTLTYTAVSTTSPSTGLAWTHSQMEISLIAIHSIDVDTVAGGGQDSIKVHQAGIRVYYDGTNYFDAVEWKARFIGKE